MAIKNKPAVHVDNYQVPPESTLRQFGLTANDHFLMWVKQDGRCAICFHSEEDIGKRFSIDHCHRSNVVRGLLCNDCNLALGLFDDDMIKVKNALAYLKARSDLARQEVKVIRGDGRKKKRDGVLW